MDKGTVVTAIPTFPPELILSLSVLLVEIQKISSAGENNPVTCDPPSLNAKPGEAAVPVLTMSC